VNEAEIPLLGDALNHFNVHSRLFLPLPWSSDAFAGRFTSGRESQPEGGG
jgi:hypothetical protein